MPRALYGRLHQLENVVDSPASVPPVRSFLIWNFGLTRRAGHGSLQPRAFRNYAELHVTPQRDHQTSGHRHDGSRRNVVFGFLGSSPANSSLRTAAVGAVVTVGKPERSSRRLFQAAVEILKKKIAEGVLIGFPQLRQFPQRVPSLAFLPRGIGQAIKSSQAWHRLWQRSSFIDDFRGTNFSLRPLPEPFYR